MNTSFPTIIELARSAGISGSPFRALTKQQRESQEELRSKFPDLDFGGRVILPWRESRALTAGGGTNLQQGGMVIGTQVPEIGQALLSAMVLERLGARILGDLQSNVDLPSGTAQISASWKTENETAGETQEVFRQLSLSPKRITAFIEVTEQLLKQGQAIEPFIRLALASALAEEIEKAAINGSGESGEPRGILNTTGIGDVEAGDPDGGAPTYAHITDLEEKAAAGAGGGEVAFLTSPKVRKKLRQTVVLASTSSDMIWPFNSANRLLGHEAAVSTAVPDNLTKGSGSDLSAILCGRFDELFLGFWGGGIGVEVIREGSGDRIGEYVVYGSVYFDSGVRHPAAFAASTDIDASV